MSVISAVMSANRTYNIEQAFNAKDITTATMRNAVTDWYSLYYCDANNDTEDTSQRLPVSVVSKLYKAIFSEYIATADGAKSGFVDEIIRGLDGVRKRAVQKMLVGGRCYIKPLLGQPMAFGVIDRRSYIPLGRDGSGNITDIGTWEQTQTGNLTYTLLERRTVDNAGYLTIENKLYRSDVPDSLGTGVPLNTLDKYASLEPTMTLPEPVFPLDLFLWNALRRTAWTAPLTLCLYTLRLVALSTTSTATKRKSTRSLRMGVPVSLSATIYCARTRTETDSLTAPCSWVLMMTRTRRVLPSFPRS